ncbi:MAG TPA: phosphatidylserine decarboxylase [Gammaproteobacteria bacterium]|nr:phosphatidylserine decarboxylase [Gammaproteobacteria bacterium]
MNATLQRTPLGNRGPTLVLQLLILAGCASALYLFAANFPYPSPLIKPLLPPEQRWPTAQVQQWVRSGHIDRGFYDFFMRDPPRAVPPGVNVVAPADGPIGGVIRTPKWTYVEIQLSFWDVHVQRAPVSGTVVSIEDAGDRIMPNSFRHDIYMREHDSPVQKIVTIASRWGLVKVRLITSLMARRIRVWVQPGEHVDKGQRIARILLGSTVVLQLPPGMPLNIRKGERMVAGETILSAPKEPAGASP